MYVCDGVEVHTNNQDSLGYTSQRKLIFALIHKVVSAVFRPLQGG